VPDAARRAPLERMASVPRMTLLTRDIRAKMAESRIRITVMPEAVRVLWKVAVGMASSLSGLWLPVMRECTF